MKAIVYTKYGPPDVLQLEEVEKPTPADNEVLLNVQAVSVNSWDRDLLHGVPFILRLGAFSKPKYPILGCDIAGRVEQIGQNVTAFKPGDEVFGDISGFGPRDWGGLAEYVCADAERLILKPAAMTFEQAAAIPQAGVLAWQGLKEGQLKKDQRVLINGAGGGTGTFAVQIAKTYGAHVTAVDSGPKLEMLRSLGADGVIDYTKEDFFKQGQRYDLILDVVTYRSLFDYRRLLSPQGRYVMLGGGAWSRVFQTIFLGPLISKFGKRKMGLLMHQPNKEDLETLTALFTSGQVKPVIDRRYPLPKTAAAFRYFATGQVKGKVVITVEQA